MITGSKEAFRLQDSLPWPLGINKYRYFQEQASDNYGCPNSSKIIMLYIHLIHKWLPTWDERAAKHRIEAFWD